MGNKDNNAVVTYSDAQMAVSSAFRVRDDMDIEQVSDLIYATSLLSDKMNGFAMLAVGLIEKNKLFEGSEFNTTAKFCQEHFGFSSGTVSSYLKTFRKFAVLDEDTNTYTIREGYEGYSASALEQMSRYDSKTIEDLTLNGAIKAGDSVRHIKDMCKRYENGEIEADGTEIEAIDVEVTNESEVEADNTEGKTNDKKVRKPEDNDVATPVVKKESFIGQVVMLYKKLAVQLDSTEEAYKALEEIPERVRLLTLKDCK